MTTTADPSVRKRRNMKRLRALAVPVIEHLPVIERGKVRSPTVVADRIIGLLAVCMKAFSAPAEMQTRFARAFKPATKLSPVERTFMRAKAPVEHARLQFTWRCEALEVLQWSVGLAAKLPTLSRQASPQKQLERVLAYKTPAGLRRALRQRTHEELLDLSDLLYRAHWATRDAGLRGKRAPRALHPSIVMERDHASRWLLSQDGQAWDDVSCDT